MKAYKVYDTEDHEGYQDIVFAETAREAKKQGRTLDSCVDAEYINIRVNRLPFLDGMENRSEQEILYIALMNGWWHDYGDTRYTEENVDDAIARGIVTPYRRGEEGRDG